MRHAISQAAIDVIAVVFGIVFLCSVACSLPFAIMLMFFAN